ncbi:hypothetical protein RhiirA4_459567 [Rhizophagus irregularis]|uniref:Uncharacterized protein n=1 Tax=Rhizophagus irregularis TaxID=588596 RepID=A0A2I1GEM3_9GLOM|nr:hypothetical protein RhiirA4_459567 [Rhizophagus irregularis]
MNRKSYCKNLLTAIDWIIIKLVLSNSDNNSEGKVDVLLKIFNVDQDLDDCGNGHNVRRKQNHCYKRPALFPAIDLFNYIPDLLQISDILMECFFRDLFKRNDFEQNVKEKIEKKNHEQELQMGGGKKIKPVVYDILVFENRQICDLDDITLPTIYLTNNIPNEITCNNINI